MEKTLPNESTQTRAIKHPSLQLQPHPTARSKAIVTESVPAGTVLLASPPLSIVLIHSEKGRRCDFCSLPKDSPQKCTGCRAYFYCDKSCQLKDWNAHHRRICKRYTRYTNSSSYMNLTEDGKLHVLLLTHLIGEHEPVLREALKKWSQDQEATFQADDHLDPINAMVSLLPKAEDELMTNDIPLPSVNADLISHLSRRFANNNFMIHCSRLNTFAHGVFPLASRFFNHSCFPSAVATYTFSTKYKGIEMNIALLRDLNPGDEVSIPYIDPALPFTRRQSKLKEIYGFRCTCILCFSPYSDVHSLFHQEALLKTLTGQFFVSICDNPMILESSEFGSLRESLWNSVDQLLPSLCERFSAASHSSLHSQAVEAGAALLVVYCILYPNNYPLIGLHALELTKVYWNAYITGNMRELGDELSMVHKTLHFAKQLLGFFWKQASNISLCHEVDPYDEVRTLESMILQEAQ